MNSSAPKKLVVIGASTGGPSHIQKILSALPALPTSALLVAQHMGSEYLPSFTSRMVLECVVPVRLVQERMVCEAGKVYICDQQTALVRHGDELRFTLGKSSGYNPDINHLFGSLAAQLPAIAIFAAILTGIGEDGVEGIGTLCSRGAVCVAESKESAIVYGMPMRAIECVEGMVQAPLNKIIDQIVEFVRC